MFLLRFDMRSSTAGTDLPDLYDTALQMAEWGEQHGSIGAFIAEHHGIDDGYLPSPLVLASAMAARTTTLPITVAALLVPLHDPVDLAEDMAVLDIVSRGRVAYVAGIGYRREEYEAFGQEYSKRGRRMEECLHAMQQAWTGETFGFEGRSARVTPLPHTAGGPPMMYGGGSPAAAERAGRLGLDFLAQGGGPELERLYMEAAASAGHQPGMCMIPPADLPQSVFVAKDPDAAWDALGQYLLADAVGYGRWFESAGLTKGVTYSPARTVDELRAENGNYQILTPTQAIDLVGRFGYLPLHPLCGGIPPDLAWASLELVAAGVLPALA